MVNRPDESRLTQEGLLFSDEGSLVREVADSLRRALICKAWCQEADALDRYAQKFPLVRMWNQPDTAFGFFGEISIDGAAVPLMGSVVDEFYDRPKADSLFAWRDGLREFVLHYFLRVSDFRLPEASPQDDRLAPRLLDPFCWCTGSADPRAGFGYTQWYYKSAETGQVGAFPAEDRFRIVDLRTVGPVLEWLVLKVSIFDFDLTFRPFGAAGPEIAIPLNEETLVIVAPDFLEDAEEPEPGVLGRYGFGYGVLRQPAGAAWLAYGPGQFDVGFSQFIFRVLDTGETRVRKIFVVNRPQRILNFPLNPLSFAARMADLVFRDGAMRPVRNSGFQASFDPVFSFIALSNVLTGGLAERVCCISREQLEKQMLVQHFTQNYQMMVGSLNTWRQVSNWRDEGTLPSWVVSGVSS